MARFTAIETGLVVIALLSIPPLALSSPPAGETAGPPQTSKNPLLTQGWQEMRYANHPKAQKAFEEALARTTDREEQAEATFGLALLWQSRPSGTDLPRAVRLYEQVAEEFGDTKSAPWALLALARNDDLPEYEKARQVESARTRYRRILKTWPDHPAADEAAYRLAQTYLEKVGEATSEDQGVAILKEWLARRPDNVMAAVMHWHLGGLYKLRRQYRLTLDHWAAADKAGIPGTEVRAMLCLSAGYIAEHKLKDYRLAITWYEKITKEIVRDDRYYVAKMWADDCRKKAAAATGPAAGGEAR